MGKGSGLFAIVGLFGTLGLIAIAGKKGRASEERNPPLPPLPPMPDPLPPEVISVIERLKKGLATLSELRNAAELALRAGFAETAEMLDRAADAMEAIETEETKLAAKLASPFSGIDDGAWSKFVSSQRTAKADFVSPGNQLGMFGMGARALADYGYMRNVTKVDHNGRMVWDGEWVEPYSLERFLRDEQLQYEAFKAQVSNHLKAIKARYPSVIGTAIEGKTATLSGLIAVARYAGLGGLDAWLKDPAKRKPETTKVYHRYNGLF